VCRYCRTSVDLYEARCHRLAGADRYFNPFPIPPYEPGSAGSNRFPLPHLLQEKNRVDMWRRLLRARCPFCHRINNIRALKETQSPILWHGLSLSLSYHTTIKITTEFRNVGDAAYAMSHAAAEACTQRLAAGRGHRYRPAAPSLQPERGTCSGPAC